MMLLTHAFERLGCVRVEFKTDARNERSQQIEQALAKLPETDRVVLRLRHFQGQSFELVAREAGLDSPDAARMRYHRALAKLARALADLEETE